MAQVYNWQLGRDMEYPYEAGYPAEQFAFVFNINRCIACQTCTMACKSTWTFSKGQEFMWWNNVESKPYGGYPQFWDMKLMQIIEQINPGGQVWDSSKKDGAGKPYGEFGGMTVFEAALKKYGPEGGQRAVGYIPNDEEWSAPNIYEDTAKGIKGEPNKMHSEGVKLPEHGTWFFYLQRLCNHCSHPACVAACPRKAIYKRPEDGIVLIDQSRCRGYRKCVEGCPYKKPMFRASSRVSEKCIACYPRIEGKDPLTGNVPTETRCMAACVGKIRMQGLVKLNPDGSWKEDKNHPLYYLIKVEKVALPLCPTFGTQPNGYYIPPRWVPRDYLRQMFGPGVDEAIEKYSAPSRELLAVLQLFRTTQKIIYSYKIEEGKKVYETTINGKKWEMFNDTVIGFGKNGEEVIRTTVEEPFYERPDKHANSI
ncbi:MAG: nitrate oxidoreductase subunit beta [Candidatus Schekmanbacteria bacterium RIFCSPLOWO2_02_FULL_38_14]|uniref:Nitrate oxidoreductase subunit beta n=1 Tax=Candidatus Schekmanbacteria bacterium RIFCSPLOWO2_12_FULL_38_15 TaxID=1817883 RepID=A0A1F7SMV2_9BACT|nr:MAG: nitrate oxidoreductase subunit beta [Candidatus Schekmanbacteria bacterium RIFCSPLOWO2_02_FULL_38_14]OGL55103.1 MAG: nitrate oxidoreductase subunit beta [Candidatus Schekmanbacteria bacterium RIFCSPLOWO2_12_FULL_38_15]